MKKVSSLTTLRTTTNQNVSKAEDNIVSPSTFLNTIATSPRKRSFREAFLADDIYDCASVQAIRNNDIEALRKLLQSGRSLNATNSNGESLLHLACRRSNVETIQFLIDNAGCQLDMVDSMGRSILHDVCWRPTADLSLAKLMLQKVPPSLWWAQDARGHTCFDYCRRHDWSIWNAFLAENGSHFKHSNAPLQ